MADPPNEHRGHGNTAVDDTFMKSGDANEQKGAQSDASTMSDNTTARDEDSNERRGHRYNGNIANDHARVQNGDQYHQYERVDTIYFGNVTKARSISSDTDSILSLRRHMVESMVISRGSILSPTRLITEWGNGEALIDAASKGQIERMKRILSERYTNIDYMSRHKTTALLSAIENGQVAAVTTLLKRGADPGLRYNKRSTSPLGIAAEFGDARIISAMLQHGAPKDELQIGRKPDKGEIWWHENRKYGVGPWTSQWSSQFDQEKYCRPTGDGVTDILAIAISRSKPAIILEWLQHGLKPHKEAILAAITLDDAKVICDLGAANADILGKFLSYRTLHYAIGAGLVNAVRGLIAAGIDVEARGQEGKRPLHFAAANNAELVRVLLAAGANAKVQDEWGWTPLTVAAWTKSEEALDILLATGADIEARTEEGCTPLHVAARADSARSTQSLIAASADIEARDDKGCTPLHFAARAGSAGPIQSLLAAGATIETRCWGGKTTLHEAALYILYNDIDTNLNGMQTLLDAGANRSAIDREGKTPYDLVLERDPENYPSNNGGQCRQKALMLLNNQTEHSDFDGRPLISAVTRQNLDADDSRVI